MKVLDREARDLFSAILLISATVSGGFGVYSAATHGQWVFLLVGATLTCALIALKVLLRLVPPQIVAGLYAIICLALCAARGLHDGGLDGQGFLAASMLIGAGAFFYGLRGWALTTAGSLVVGVAFWFNDGAEGGLPFREMLAELSLPLACFMMAGATGTLLHFKLTRVTRRLEAQQRDLQRTTALLETEIKQRTHAQSELARAYHLALEGAGVKSAFLANMSHELRTPMNAVVGLTDLLLRDELTPHQRENLETVQESSQGLLVLLDDLLDLSKIEAGAMRLDAIDFAPRDVLLQLERLFTPKARTKGVGLEMVCEPGVPPVLKGDPLRLSQVLTNLIGNSMKFTEKGRVRVLLSWLEPRLRIEVSDTGIGMTPEQVGALFQPFTQADNSMTRRFGGTGLGLAIVKRLCELHEGDVTVTSEITVGSTFVATLRYTLGAPMRPKRSSNSLKPVLPIEGLRVLIAEDNVINQRVAERMLTRLGVSFAVACNGVEAVKEVSRGAWDIVLMDLQMPEMDGLEATRRIRAAPGEQPVIIAVSANAMEEDKAAARDAGVDNFLAKPITLDALSEALRRGRDGRPTQVAV